MTSSSDHPELIIALSSDKVTINMPQPDHPDLSALKTSFDIPALFLEEEISLSLDQALLAHPELMDHFSSVEVLVMDRPNVIIPFNSLTQSRLPEIIGRYLRLRSGDMITSDDKQWIDPLWYTFPVSTVLMLREYYANISITHFSSLLWHSLKSFQTVNRQEPTLYLTQIHKSLIIIGEQNGNMFFLKNFPVHHEADIQYYALACSRMLNTLRLCSVSIEHESPPMQWPDDASVRIDQYLYLPSIPTLLARYKECES